MQTVEQEVSSEAVVEWLESPITEWFVKALERRADYYTELRANAFIPGDPNRTQEAISFFNGTINELNALYGAINEDAEAGEPSSLNYIDPEFEE